MKRIYIEEAFILVITSSMMGVGIGTLVGYTMTLQQILFTQLPIPFAFPTTLLIFVVIISLLSALIAAFMPIRKLMKEKIVAIFRK